MRAFNDLPPASAAACGLPILHVKSSMDSLYIVLGGVLDPKVDFPHLVHSGDQEFAADLCEKMRKAQAKAPIPNGANIYTVVPLPVTSEEAGV